MSKYTEVELKDECLAWGNYYIDLVASVNGWKIPGEDFDKWRDERNKPAKKIIDLAPLIESGIDCEFWDDDAAPFRFISTLELIFRSSAPRPHPLPSNGYSSAKDSTYYPWEKCRPRMNHKMFHNGGKCPLPEGFKLRIYFRGSAVLDKHLYLDCQWLHTDAHFSDVIGYEILGLADGYAYPWEEQS